MAMENKRIIQLNTERTTPAADDYVMVDSATAGTAKYLLPKITDAIDQEISDRTSADTAINGEITQLKEDLTAEETARANAVSAEATAREAADDAINAELATKADANGTIASAEQLLSDKYTVDQVPYLFRPSGGSGADREYDEIVGGSIVWNQLCNGSSVTVLNGHKYYMIKGGTASIGASTGSAITGLTSGTDVVSDLTQMFGSTIADYIYSLEQATAGAGVAWFKQFFSEDYYSYDAGTMKHVEGLSAHIMRDADENIIGNYPLDDSLTLRGIPKLDSNNQLYYDGDIYSADGTVTRKYGIVDLGTLTWTLESGLYYTTLTDRFPNGTQGGGVCSKYVVYGRDTWGRLVNNLPDKNLAFTNDSAQKYVVVKDTAYATAAAFKAAMSGVYLVYELATPTTETATPFTNPQVCDPYGTEEYVTTSLVPVGHYTKYPANLRSAIERVMEQVPEAPSANGTYTLKATRTSSGATYAWTAE